MSPIYRNNETDERVELPRPNPRLDRSDNWTRLGSRGDDQEDGEAIGVLSQPTKAVNPQPARRRIAELDEVEAADKVGDAPEPEPVNADEVDELRKELEAAKAAAKAAKSEATKAKNAAKAAGAATPAEPEVDATPADAEPESEPAGETVSTASDPEARTDQPQRGGRRARS